MARYRSGISAYGRYWATPLVDKVRHDIQTKGYMRIFGIFMSFDMRNNQNGHN